MTEDDRTCCESEISCMQNKAMKHVTNLHTEGSLM